MSITELLVRVLYLLHSGQFSGWDAERVAQAKADIQQYLLEQESHGNA